MDPSANAILVRGASPLLAWLCRALASDRGQDLTEYALLAALIAVVTLATVRAFGVTLGAWWTALSTQVADVAALVP